MNAHHLLINGLSIGSGGGYTVGRELTRGIAEARPTWTLTFALIKDHPLHEQMRNEQWPDNCHLLWVNPAAAARFKRVRIERRELSTVCETRKVDAVLQLNGMLVRGIGRPSLCHNQDPWPYRPEAWGGVKDRILAAFKRKANGYALRNAQSIGWTSGYLRDLICGYHNHKPQRQQVYFNGVPDDWIERAESGNVPPIEGRPMQLTTVSNVSRYKRQDLVIRAVAELSKRPAFADLQYRIAGHASDAYQAELRQLCKTLGVADRVHLEGRVRDERVQELLAQSRAFVLMSVCESFGIPAVEAMSFGTPAVVADCCAIPEVCGDAAVRSPMDDLAALTENLARVLTDDAEAARLRTRGIDRLDRFRWRHTSELFAKEFDALLG